MDTSSRRPFTRQRAQQGSDLDGLGDVPVEAGYAAAFPMGIVAISRAPGGALEGVDAHFQGIAHDWNRVPALRDALARLAEGSPVMVGSSEGALFDYGSDEAIVGNLVALRETTPDDFCMVGDALRDSELVRLSGRETGFQFRALGREGFEALARQAGWAVEAAVDEPACLAFRLVKA